MTDEFACQKDDLKLEYSFSVREIRALARYLRIHQAEIPEGLEDFAAAVEKAVYNAMSISEAEQFYS
ncbi:MAG: hypothetical protein K6G80_05655 [Treponema sp.]|nr:hypothetical protein [Treponema sp.]